MEIRSTVPSSELRQLIQLPTEELRQQVNEMLHELNIYLRVLTLASHVKSDIRNLVERVHYGAYELGLREGDGNDKQP